MRFGGAIAFLGLLQLARCISVQQTLVVSKNILDWAISVSETWDIVNGYGNFVDSPREAKEKRMMAQIDNINVRLEELDGKIGQLQNDIEAIARMLRNLPKEIRYELRSNDLIKYENFISISYERMKTYASYPENYEKSTLIEFSNSVTSNLDNSVLQLMDRIYHVIVVDPHFLQLLQESQKNQNQNLLCHEKSPQQTYYNLLEKMLMINWKAYITIQFAYMIKKMYGLGNFSQEAEDATNEFEFRTNHFISTIKNYMINASREIWMCDPEQHVQGKTYVEITSLLQGYILNKVNLEAKGDCKPSCSDFTYTKTYECHKNKWCLKQKPECPKIVDCQLIDDDMTVCKSNISSGRRYKYVEHGNGRVFGKKTHCSKQNTFELSGYREWVLWKCQYCFCLCDYGEKARYYSDRFINLRTAMADISDNRVVTGLRFIKHNRIIHLQVQEGKLLPGGQIDPNTVHWVPPENYNITDRYIYEGQDYHILTWEKRGFDLGSIMADKGSIVTGVRLRRLGTRVDLEVLITPFNFTTGQLKDPHKYSVYKDSLNPSLKQKFAGEIKLIKPDIPTRSTSPSIPNHVTNKYIRFVNSDFDKDAAQSTVPFFDAQPVQSLAAMPLCGVGLYYKGRNGYGGFIAPKIITYDISQHLGPVYPSKGKN